jgi:outer membrane murein-binding lipoprotein Lpp
MVRSSNKIRRLVGLFRNLETTERAKVAELTVQIADLQTAQEELLSSLSNPTAETDPFLPLMSRSVGNMNRRMQRLERDREAAVRRYAQAAGRTHGASALLSDVRAEEKRKTEQKDLESLLEFQQSVIAQGRCKSSGSI